MQETSTKTSAPGFYLALRIASWVALGAIAIAIGWATTQAIINWNAITV